MNKEMEGKRRERADVHVHSHFSADSEESMEKEIETAISEGISVLCFTDHIDWDYPVEDLVFDFDIPTYFQKIDELKEKYAGQIKILKGVELGLQVQLKGPYSQLLKKYDFDYAIGSQHLVGGMDPYYPETFEGHTDAEVFRRYFEDTLEDLKAFHEFDSMGHLDYVVRYGQKKAHDYSYRRYADVIDEILKLLVRYNIALEVNTCGIRKQLGFPNPHPDIIRRYHELGGTLVTLGSDAHKARFLGFAFERAESLLKECGFTHYCYFEKHTPHFIRL